VYTPGKLIYFDPFHFKDGSKPKSKYFLVLKVVGDNAILASLPSSVNHLPQAQALNHGCLEIPDACISCYIFEQNRPITTSGWSFPFHTMLYGNWLDDFEVSVLEKNYPIPSQPLQTSPVPHPFFKLPATQWRHTACPPFSSRR